MAPGGSARTAGNEVAGCLGYLALALFAGFCWLAWTNRPIAIWCVAGLIVAAVAEGIREKAAGEPGFVMRTSIALVVGVRNLALGLGLASGIGWIVQILLNLIRDRADPTAVLDLEAQTYDLSAALETILSATVIAAVIVISLVIALLTNSWAAVRLTNRAKGWLSWASVILASAITITFVSADEAASRQQFALGPIRASIGGDLTRLRDARRRKIAAQWLTAEIIQDPPAWRRLATGGDQECQSVNTDYRSDFRKLAAKANPAFDGDGGSDPCEKAKFAPAVIQVIVPATPAAKPAPSLFWLADERSMSSGEPSVAPQPLDDAAMLDDVDTREQAPVIGPTPLSREALSLPIAQAKTAANRIKAKADEETAAAAAWENLASSALSSLAGEMDHGFRAAFIKSCIDTLAERVAAESGDMIGERLKAGGGSTATPRDAAALFAKLPRVIFPIAVAQAGQTAETVRSTLARALTRYLPDGDTKRKRVALASASLARAIAKDTGKPANIYDADGHVIGTAEPPEAWHPWTRTGRGPGSEPRPEPPHPEFHGIP